MFLYLIFPRPLCDFLFSSPHFKKQAFNHHAAKPISARRLDCAGFSWINPVIRDWRMALLPLPCFIPLPQMPTTTLPNSNTASHQLQLSVHQVRGLVHSSKHLDLWPALCYHTYTKVWTASKFRHLQLREPKYMAITIPTKCMIIPERFSAGLKCSILSSTTYKYNHFTNFINTTTKVKANTSHCYQVISYIILRRIGRWFFKTFFKNILQLVSNHLPILLRMV